MKKTFTKQFIRENSGCYTQVNDYSKVNALDFMQGEGKIVTPQMILESSIPLKDKYWFFCKKVFTKEQNQQVAIGAAWIVLEMFEKKYPNDDRPRKAIKAAEDYLAGVINIETLMDTRRNAAAAAADADADAAAADAYADAYAAAADAYAAAAAAYAAAYAAAAAAAAYAYAYAAAAYAYAYAAAEKNPTYTKSLLTFLIQFCTRHL